MTRPIHPALELRRAAALHMLNTGHVEISQAALLRRHQSLRDRAQQGGLAWHARVLRRLEQVIGDINQRLFGAALHRVNGGYYLDYQVGQKGGEVICVDGDGFRLVAGRHRVFLYVGDKLHAFTLDTPAGVEKTKFAERDTPSVPIRNTVATEGDAREGMIGQQPLRQASREPLVIAGTIR